MPQSMPKLPRKFGAFDGDFETDTSIVSHKDEQVHYTSVCVADSVRETSGIVKDIYMSLS